MSSRQHGTRSKARASRTSSEALQSHNDTENVYGRRFVRHHVHSIPWPGSDVLEDDDDDDEDWQTVSTSSFASRSSSDSTSAQRNNSESVWGSNRFQALAEETDQCERSTNAEIQIKMEDTHTKRARDNLIVTGSRGDKKRKFEPTRVTSDGKLHHGAFVLGVRKSQECLKHDKKSEVHATNHCNFAHGWKGDTLQYVCTKCTEENLNCCKEKIRHESFIWNLGPYRTNSGDIWKG